MDNKEQVVAQAVQVAQQVPELKVLFAQMIQSIMQGTGNAVDFVLEQAPEVIQQLVLYHMVWYWCIVIGGAAVVVMFVRYCRWAGADMQLPHYSPSERATFARNNDARAAAPSRRYEDTDIYYVIVAGWFIFCVMPAALAVLCNIGDALKITLAPKVWLIEYAVHLLR